MMRKNPVKQALRAGQPSVGTWLSLGNITAARFLARAGFAWLTVDIEHSLVDWETATHIFASVADAGCTALAASMRGPTGKPPSGEATTQVMKRILDACRRNKVAPGLHTGSADEARVRIDEGWQFIAVASELRFMLNAADDVVQKLGL